ncbi:MAG TPA: xylan 1,4-beta-xylosidase [Chloroflexota bacterium]|nr:xylan 1,4-beta-xylosidase [Chloroflexota bacterium]
MPLTRALGAILVVAQSVLIAFIPSPVPTGGPDVLVTIDRTDAIGSSDFDVGVSHMQYSLDNWGDPVAVARAKNLLRASVRYSNQHIMGFGAENPEPWPGIYSWDSLDARIQLARDLGLTPVITLCCAPDWMWGGPAGTTDWSKLGTAPTPDHYADFAELARQVALRYPDVRYYQVWNEFKGLWNDRLNTWDAAAYTALYNQVYDALKAVDPAIQVGGPYLVIEGTGSRIGFWGVEPVTRRDLDVIDYWLAHKHGADFIVLDRPVKDVHDPASYTDAQLLQLTEQFEKISGQIHARTSLPIWWAEDYFSGSDNWDLQAVGLASILYHELKGGSAVSLRWEPQSQPNEPFGGDNQNLFSSTLVAGGGQPYPTYNVYRAFHQYFGPGTTLYHATSSSTDVEVLASDSHTMLINKRPSATSIAVNGMGITLSGYEVVVL